MHYRQLLPFFYQDFFCYLPRFLLLKKFFVIQTMNPTGECVHK